VEFEVAGIATDTKFVIRPRGNPTSAALSVEKTLDAQSLGGGEYRRYFVDTPTTNPAGSVVRTELYINGDKKSKIVKTLEKSMQRNKSAANLASTSAAARSKEPLAAVGVLSLELSPLITHKPFWIGTKRLPRQQSGCRGCRN